jgi:uncharacterized membrane protein (UPF0127 family)
MNRTRNTLLGSQVELASSWWRRLRGYIGRPEPRPGEGILLLPCDGIHTYLMSYDLDVLFLDERGKVLKAIRSLSPWKRSKRVPGARYVLEVPSGTIETSGTAEGDELTWTDPAPYAISVLSSRDREGNEPRLMVGGGKGV